MRFHWFIKLRQDSLKAKEELQQQIGSIRDATKAAEQKQAEVGSAIVAAINKVANTTPDYASPQRQNEYRLQWKMFWATLAAAVFAGAAAGGAFWYAHIANQQLSNMQESAYYTCRNVQGVLDALSESEIQTRFSYDMASAAIRQEKVETEGQRAKVVVLPEVPSQRDIMPGIGLGVPYIVKNEGRSPAFRFVFRSKAVLLYSGDVLRITTANLQQDRHPFIAAERQIPELAPSDSPYRPAQSEILVRDSRDNVATPAQVADFLDAKTARIATYGIITYSDFSGDHEQHFCDIKGLMNPGTAGRAIQTQSDETCNKYNYSNDAYSEPIDLGPAPPVPSLRTSLTCIPPPK